MVKKELGECKTVMTTDDLVKAYEETHPSKEKKRALKVEGPVETVGQIGNVEAKPQVSELSDVGEVQLSDLEQLKRDVDAALSLLPRVKALLAQIVILPDVPETQT